MIHNSLVTVVMIKKIIKQFYITTETLSTGVGCVLNLSSKTFYNDKYFNKFGTK